jgi:hypothetical protein
MATATSVGRRGTLDSHNSAATSGAGPAQACAPCPLLAACATYTADKRERHGVWAGVDRETHAAPGRQTAPRPRPLPSLNRCTRLASISGKHFGYLHWSQMPVTGRAM